MTDIVWFIVVRIEGFEKCLGEFLTDEEESNEDEQDLIEFHQWTTVDRAELNMKSLLFVVLLNS